MSFLMSIRWFYRIQGYNNIPGLPIHVFLYCPPSPRISHTKVEFTEDEISTEDYILWHLTTKDSTKIIKIIFNFFESKRHALNYEIKKSLIWQQKFDDWKK